VRECDRIGQGDTALESMRSKHQHTKLKNYLMRHIRCIQLEEPVDKIVEKEFVQSQYPRIKASFHWIERVFGFAGVKCG